MNKNVVLLSFYNPKQIGVKYLEASLKAAGYYPIIVSLKRYNSIKPNNISNEEIKLLKELINEKNPLFIGFSVMSSFHLEMIENIQREINSMEYISVWGGVFITLMPEIAFKYGAKYVLMGECEEAIVKFSDAIKNNNSIFDLPNVAYLKDGNVVKNQLLPLKENIDDCGMPEACNNNRILIENNRIYYVDQNLNSYGYEISATRGCPFSCSYCSSINLKRLYTGNKFVRFRSVDHLISELKDAKKQIKKLKFIHFWDEIFPDNKEWIDEFTYRYKTEIGLPFEIWGHPVKINEYTIKKLVEAGLFEITVGIQSGSEYIRKEIFNRHETKNQILKAVKILNEYKVPSIVYDFMLRHSFEKIENIKDSYELLMKIPLPYSLQLHGLGFLPGTDICEIAMNRGIYSKEELNQLMFGKTEDIYKNFWGQSSVNEEMDFWYNLIYLTQFKSFRNKTKKYSNNFLRYKNKVKKCVLIASYIEKMRYYLKKSKIFFNFI